VAVVAVVLIAPQGTEFGAKVGLLASLVMISCLRDVFDRVFPDTTDPDHGRLAMKPTVMAEALATVITMAAVAIGGARATDPTATPDAAGLAAAALVPTGATPVQEQEIAPIEVDPAVVKFKRGWASADGKNAARALVHALAVEAQAIETGDASMLIGIDLEPRLGNLTAAIEGTAVAPSSPACTPSRMRLIVSHPLGPQNVARPAIEIDAGTPCHAVYAMYKTRSGQWFITEQLDPEGPEIG